MTDFDVEEWDDWHKDLIDWERNQDKLDLIAPKMSQEEYLVLYLIG